MPFYFGTILLESNRWRAPGVPSYCVSEWLPRIRAAGFDGIELWQNHALACAPAELDQLAQALQASAWRSAPIFSSYATLATPTAELARTADVIAQLGASAMKFNFSASAEALIPELRWLREWRTLLPDGLRLLCECHPGTALETPEAARMATDAWGDADFEIIVHPFQQPRAALERWLRIHGPRVTHAHVQMHAVPGAAAPILAPLAARRDYVREQLAVLHDHGFGGSFTIEFTAGVGIEPEDPAALFAAAVADLELLRDLWS